MRSLIINADDLGVSDAVNEAIGKCYASGAITGASIMACGTRFREACKMLRDIKKTEIGVHLTLTGKFHPVSYNRSTGGSLSNNDGLFRAGYLNFAMGLCTKKIKIQEVYSELKCQISKVLDEGLSVTHLDGHEHIHLMPEILVLVAKLAKEFNVPYVRVPLENSAVIMMRPSLLDLVRHIELKIFAKKAEKFLYANDFVCVNFLGHYHAGRVDDDILCKLVSKIPNGVTELALHPAVKDDTFSNEFPWYSNAAHEYSILTGGRWRECLKKEGIQLITHKEAALYL